MAIRSYSARAWSAASPRSRRIWSSLACVFAVGLIAAGGGAATAATPDSVAASTAARAMAVYDATLDSTWMFLPRLPDDEGSCYLYPRYIAVAWRSPDLGEPVAIVRERDPAAHGFFEPPRWPAR